MGRVLSLERIGGMGGRGRADVKRTRVAGRERTSCYGIVVFYAGSSSRLVVRALTSRAIARHRNTVGPRDPLGIAVRLGLVLAGNT